MSQKKEASKILKVISACICVFLALILVCNLTIIIKGTINPDTPPGVGGFTSMIVMSGSMSGTAEDHIEVGDMIIAKKVNPDTLKVGDIVTFMEGKTAVTHRIVEINEDGTFTTKGDANNAEDQNPVAKDKIIGKYLFRIPKLGDLALFMQTPIGMLIFIGIPLVIYILLDVLLRARFNKKKNQMEADAEKDKEDMQAEIEKLRAQLAEKDGSSKTE